MKNAESRILYVGKAKSLRRRVLSYFRPGPGLKTQSLMSKVKDIEVLVTRSENEALLLEDNLIKEHKPRYNISFRDDKSFVYLSLSRKHPYPMVTVTRRPHSEDAEYFGPFPGVKSAELMGLVNRHFRIRHCKTSGQFKEGRLCLDYHIHRCPGPCALKIDEAEYEAEVRRVRLLLGGKTGELAGDLKGRMEASAEALDFERAAALRDRLQAVQRLGQEQKVVQEPGLDQDAVVTLTQEGKTLIQVLSVRDGKLVGRFRTEATGEGPDLEEDGGLSAYLGRAYGPGSLPPPEILVNREPAERTAIEAALAERRGGPVRIHLPQRGARKRLLDLALRNAEEQFRLAGRVQARAGEAVEDLRRRLSLREKPSVIEGFDIAHTQGDEAVGSMVRFVDGQPDKKGYRKFKIKTVKGIDDYAMMGEVLRRRYSRLGAEEGRLPDLIMVDGGRGHLKVAEEVLDDLGLGAQLEIVALAKREELIYKRGHDAAYRLAEEGSGHRLLRHVRDEAHRTANAFHAARRGKRAKRSLLEGLPGLGPRLRARVYEKFGSLESFLQVDPSFAAQELRLKEEKIRAIRDHLKSRS